MATLVAVLLPVLDAGDAATQQAPKRGGTVYILRDEPTSLNPLKVRSDADVRQVLEGAYEVGPDLRYRPSLVSRVTIESKRPFVLTYHIRPEARWSDGMPVSAYDFRFTQEAFASYGTAVGYDKVRRTQILTPKTYRIELQEPFGGWRELYSTVLPRHALAGEDLERVWNNRIDNPKTGRRIGSGPFLVGSLERGRELTLVRNPRYWGDHTAYLDRLVGRFPPGVIPPPDALERVRRNEIDVALMVAREDAAQVRALPGWRVLAWPGSAQEHLLFRVGAGGHPALRLKLVRQALAFGIDRVAIARAIQADAHPTSRRPLDSTTFLPTESSYRAAWSRYRYDPVRAQTLLRQAGCRRGRDSIFSCAGEPLSLRFVTTAGDAVRELTLQLMQAHLRKAGVEVVPEFAPSRVVFGQILPNGEFDAALFAWSNNGGGVAWPETWCGHASNWGGYCDRLVQRDLKQTDLIVEPRQRARVLNAADRKLARAVPVLPIVQAVLYLAVRDTIRGVIGGGTQFQLVQNTEDWWLAQPR